MIKNINNNPDTVFHTPRLILDSIRFGDRCCKTAVGKLLAVPINTMILDHSHTHSFSCYLMRSRVILFVLVLSLAAVATMAELSYCNRDGAIFRVWAVYSLALSRKTLPPLLRKWMELERYHSIEKALNSFVPSDRGNMKCGSHPWTSERLYFYVAASSITLAGTQGLALNLPNTPYPELSYNLNLKEPAVIWQCV